MTEEDLRKFDKETLVQFIFADSVFYRQETMDKLHHYEKRQRFNRLMARSEKITEQMRQCSGFEDDAKWNSLVKKDQKIHREINKILGI